MEQMQYNLLFRWFVGLGIDNAVWVPIVFTKNRDRLLATDMSRKVMAAIEGSKRHPGGNSIAFRIEFHKHSPFGLLPYPSLKVFSLRLRFNSKLLGGRCTSICGLRLEQ